MYSYFSDLHVELLSRGVLEPGEQLTGKTVTRYMPWWAFGFINRTYLVLTTDRRVVLLDHRMHWLHQAQSLRAVESLPWSNVQELAIKGLFTKKLRVRGQAQSGAINLTMPIPNRFFGLLAPMRQNMAGARAVAGSFAAQRGLAPQSFPMGAPQAQQLGAYAAQPELPPASGSYYPPQNAPGYQSSPPPSAQPASFQPQSQPQQYAAPTGPGIPPLPPRRSYPQV